MWRGPRGRTVTVTEKSFHTPWSATKKRPVERLVPRSRPPILACVFLGAIRRIRHFPLRSAEVVVGVGKREGRPKDRLLLCIDRQKRRQNVLCKTAVLDTLPWNRCTNSNSRASFPRQAADGRWIIAAQCIVHVLDNPKRVVRVRRAYELQRGIRKFSVKVWENEDFSRRISHF